MFSNLQIGGEKLQYTLASPLPECVNVGGIVKWWWCQTNPNYYLKPYTYKSSLYKYPAKHRCRINAKYLQLGEDLADIARNT